MQKTIRYTVLWETPETAGYSTETQVIIGGTSTHTTKFGDIPKIISIRNDVDVKDILIVSCVLVEVKTTEETN